MRNPYFIDEQAAISFSGRVTALRDKGMIQDTGLRRDRCRVMRVMTMRGAA
jgi:hypothetical protein